MMEILLTNRNREIVKIAASIAKTASTRRWLLNDEHGVFENMAAGMLISLGPKIAQLELTDEQANNELAKMLVLNAIEAQLRTRR